MNAKKNILVIEATTRASIPVIRSFVRRGFRVIAAADRRWCAGLCVRGVVERQVYPPVKDSPQAFMDWLLGFLGRRHIEMLLPLGDLMTEVIARHREHILRHTSLFMPEYDRLLIAHDKILTNKAAVAAGVPIPDSWYPDEEGLDRALRAGRYPVLVKPAVEVGARGILRADSPGELERTWAEAVHQYPRSFVQELVPLTGRQFVVDALLDRSCRMVAGVVTEKLRFYPVKGGTSVVNRSIRHEGLLKSMERLLSSFGCYGPDAADFIQDPRDGLIKLLELNPRYGETQRICEVVGVDMPYMAYRLAAGLPVDPVTTYPEGKYMRFLPGDLMWFLHSPDRFRGSPGFFELFGMNPAGVLRAGTDWGPVLGYFLENLFVLMDAERRWYRFRR